MANIPHYLLDLCSVLLMLHPRRFCSAVKLVVRRSEDGQECAHLYSMQYYSCLENNTNSLAMFIANPSDGVSLIAVECVGCLSLLI